MNIVLMEPLGIAPEALKKLSVSFTEAGHQFTAYDTRETEEEKLIARVKEAEILLLANQPLPASVIAACTKLKMISVAFTGVDHVDTKFCKEKGITVCNAAGYSTNAVAELAFALMLDVYRHILPCDSAVRQSGTKGTMIGRELHGKTLGIIGTGAIGLRTAEIAKVFGCRLIGYSRTQRPEAEALGITYKTLPEVLEESDIVSLHLPMSTETKCLLDAAMLKHMKKSAILINTARGGIVDNAALAEALNAGAIAGAGIDVFEMEPPIPEEHPLCTAKNTVLTPHVAFATEEALLARAEIVFQNIKCYLDGVPQNVIC